MYKIDVQGDAAEGGDAEQHKKADLDVAHGESPVGKTRQDRLDGAGQEASGIR
ncbi:hypothetical protein [Pseudomonas protegens]|uniref:hypothetical protein n=1 Tax=Pseudomonas protegens TaxID=380021 RepID=UPI0015E8A08F|nr:hypothetical protein [Pseudomonas protegens]